MVATFVGEIVNSILEEGSYRFHDVNWSHEYYRSKCAEVIDLTIYGSNWLVLIRG